MTVNTVVDSGESPLSVKAV